MIRRKQLNELMFRIKEPRKTIHVIAGPRQIGKTTMIKQALEEIKMPSLFFNADAVDAKDKDWISLRWEEARSRMQFGGHKEFLLVLDEIHKIDKWSEHVKKEWDIDTFNDVNLKVVLLGSSRILLKQGLTESLAGRFEILHLGHWTFQEMNEAFGLDINQYIYFGGYPGSANYITNESRWRAYIRNSIISPAIEKDVLQTSYIYKPALMHQLFSLGCAYSGELLSFNKMLGNLSDAGNSTTLSNYLELLSESELLTGLQKYSIDKSRKYRSTPKLQVHNNALLTAMTDGMTYHKAFTTPDLWGRWVESSVGCHLLENASRLECQLYYWRENNEEVDFILVRGEDVVAIEVKSGHNTKNRGLSLFNEKFHPRNALVVGKDALPLDEFFKGDISVLF